MNLEELEKSNRIFFKTIVGSKAYGTSTPESDTDIKGFFWIPPQEFLGLYPPVSPQDGQINDEKHNVTFYSLYRTFELLRTANPNLIELLWMPEDCILYSDSVIMPTLLENRHLFITKQAYQTHAGYAKAQIKKAKGKNKKVHNPAPKERPVKEDFCRVIPVDKLCEYYSLSCLRKNVLMDYFPFRPIPLKDSAVDLSRCHVASLEYAPNVYRLYDYGDAAKGVFRGNDMLCCESIPKENEWQKIIGLLIYDKNEYDKAVKDWHSYWTWIKERNEKRWTSQENKRIDYDVKNLMHCFRLLYSGINILREHEPLVRFKGEKLKFLRDIREEKYTYKELTEKLQDIERQMEEAFNDCTLPEDIDKEKMDSLYRFVNGKREKC